MGLKFSKLTRLEMRKLAPGRALGEHGITFKRLSNGDGRFSVNIMVDGVRVHRVLGMESSGVTRKQAEDFIERARTDARQGRLNLPKGRKLTLTFSEAAQRYTDRLAETGGKDLDMKRYRLRAHLCPFFTDKPLSRVTTFDVERYKKKRIEASATPGSVNRELATLSHLFTKAVEWKWLDHRPASIKRLSEDRGRITYLTIEQIERLLAAARADQSFEVYPFIVIGLETGMRRMEILSIRRENIDLGRRVIFVTKAKAGAREQPITAHLAHYLAGGSREPARRGNARRRPRRVVGAPTGRAPSAAPQASANARVFSHRGVRAQVRRRGTTAAPHDGGGRCPWRR
jgi:integrase